MARVSLCREWRVTSGTLSSLPSVVAGVEGWQGEVRGVEHCLGVVAEVEGSRGELVITPQPGQVIPPPPPHPLLLLPLLNSSSQVVTGVGILSSSPLWEVVGGIHYLASIRGDKISLGVEEEVGEEEKVKVEEVKEGSKEKGEEMFVYQGRLSLGQGHASLTLRLPPSASSCWVYALAASLAPAPAPAPASSHFSMPTVDHLLATNPRPLSDKALQFRAMFQAFQTSGPLAPSPGPLGQEPAPSSLHAPPSTPASSNSAPPSISTTSAPPSTPAPPSLAAPSLLLMQPYIDSKFASLESRLLAAVAAAEQRQAARLDAILALLQGRE